MKKNNYLVLFVFAITLSVSSCKKDESTPTKVMTTQERKKEMVIAVSWKISSQVKYDAPVAIVDCEKDDLYAFSADGTFSLNVGSLVCNGETNSSGIWIISPDGNGLLTFGSTTLGMVVTSSQMILSRYDPKYDEISDQLTLIPK
jgi:hypothetical protein